mmetsp:Transcript_4981/g.18062  ORF Transcript_4981/g.18062 Transcript_4981/m.18062 type:complete len:153 (+) Transcript_4981:752-1210(+)
MLLGSLKNVHALYVDLATMKPIYYFVIRRVAAAPHIRSALDLTGFPRVIGIVRRANQDAKDTLGLSILDYRPDGRGRLRQGEGPPQDPIMGHEPRSSANQRPSSTRFSRGVARHRLTILLCASSSPVQLASGQLRRRCRVSGTDGSGSPKRQ